MKKCASLLFICAFIQWQFQVVEAQPVRTFTNPLLPSGADPWSIYKDGFYYYMNTLPDSLVIWKTKDITDLATAEKKTIWIPQPGTKHSRQLWAPEIHYFRKRWYTYFAADDGNNNNHRIYVIENKSQDPMKGTWVFKGKVADGADKWAIDASVFEVMGQLYMVWSGWEGDKNGQQDIFIAKMKNPWTIEGERSRISSPVFEWEKKGDLASSSNPSHVNVNEGPEILQHDDQLFIIYSASGCWTDYYALGMLSTRISSNLLDSVSWKKSASPVFKESIENGVYAPGHNSFFKSPDGTEDWILYHANQQPNQGCGRHRSPRIQKFTWNIDGTPNFGTPAKAGISIPAPSEIKAKDR